MTVEPIFVIVLIGLFVWSFAEAFVWPVVPDAAMAVVAFLVPEWAIASVLALAVGSVVGGVLGVALGRAGRSWPLPMVTGRMQQLVAEWLDAGAFGLVYQPLTAVPYKAFVVEAAERPIGLAAWGWATALFRGARMTVIAAVAVGTAAMLNRWVPAGSLAVVRTAVVAGAIALFLIGWRFAFRSWQRREKREALHSG